MGGGGAERQLSYLAAAVARHGVETHVALLRGGPNLLRLESTGAKVHLLGLSSNYDPRIVSRLRALIRRVRPDVVQSWLPQMDILTSFAMRGLRTPWVMGERTSADAFRGTWQQRLRIVTASRATAIVANSAGGARFWSKKPNVRVIPNALPIGEIDAAKAATDVPLPSQARLVVAAGRCVPEKNQQVLIDAIAELPKDVFLAICGDGPLLEETRQRAVKKEVGDRVLFPGYVSAIWSWMKRADLFASVGWYEGHPNAVLEAMAARTPVVVSDIEAHRSVATEREALFANPADARDLAAAIAKALDDRAATAMRVESARRRAEEFSVEAFGEAYVRLYRELTEGQR